ncbi:hypothetical protein BDW62DRAFT_104438 [Aspergillus aurantiobrunneus]
MALEESTDTIEAFEINLSPGDGEGGFHTKNPPRQPFHRRTVHEDRGSVRVKCSLVDVAHGKWSPDSADYASLIVLGFRFEPGKTGRRITSAIITITFWGESEGDDHPGVARISLNDQYALVPTTQDETTTKGLGGSFGLQLLGAGQASLDPKYEKAISRQTSDATYISGSSCMIGVDWEPDNAVEWKLRENQTLKTGIPGYLRAGILLRRETTANFQCMVEIDTEVDMASRIGRWFGSKPKDEPVLFNPGLNGTHNLMKYDLDNLGAMDMTLVQDVVVTTVLDGVVRHANVR